MKRPAIFLFCYRFFDIRHLVSAGVIRALSQRVDIVLLAPDNISELLRRQLGSTVTIESLRLDGNSFDENGLNSRSFRHMTRAYIALVFSFVYGNPHLRPNLSAILHRTSYIKRCRKKGLSAHIRAMAVVAAAQILSRSLVARRFVQFVYSRCAHNNAHADLYEKYRPTMSLVCSFGLSVDGLILTEAKRRGVPTSTLVQSWDKTSTKGYPVSPPDSAILWSDITADEANIYLDMPRDRIFVEGAPLWDKYYGLVAPIEREQFFGQHGLSASGKLLFIALGATNYHGGNIDLIRKLVHAKQTGVLPETVQLLFRQHPSYLMYRQQYEEVEAVIKEQQGVTGIAFTKPSVMQQNDAFSLVDEDDFVALTSAFTHCDVSVSVASSHLIEASIFDKPTIDIEYGRWISEIYDFDLSGYAAEHLHRLYRTGAIYRATSWHILLEQIQDALLHPQRKSAERKALVDQEVPVNRGSAAARIADRLVALSSEKPPQS